MSLLWNTIKLRRSFSFRKSELEQQGDHWYNYTYRTISSAYIMTKAKEIADKNHCRLEGIYGSSWKVNGIIICLVSTKKDYVNFCSDFCETLGNYIEDIEMR